MEANRKFQIPNLYPMELPALGESPLVSVLIPNYNYEKYVGQALDSLLAQTYTNWEAVVCDDGSTDRSRDIIEEYAAKDSRIRFILQENGGVAQALNTCFGAARGEVISLLDADDLFLPYKLQQIIEAFAGHPFAGMCVHPIQPFDAEGYTGTPDPIEIADGWTAPQALRNGGYDPRFPPTSGLSFRCSVLRLAFPLPSELRRGLDFYITGICIMATEIVGLPEVLTLYRVHSANVSGAIRVGGDFLDRTLADQGAVLKARCERLRSVFGSWPAMELEENQAARNSALHFYLLEGKTPTSLPLAPSLLIQKEPDWRIRTTWRMVLLMPPAVRRSCSALLRAWNSRRKMMLAPSERRARCLQHDSF